MEWKESVEHCFFTDYLDRQLKEFLIRQKSLSSEAEYWEFIHKTAYEWEEKCSAYFEEMMMPSFFRQWNIGAYWMEFSTLKTSSYTLEETLYWTFLTGWVLSEVDEVHRKNKITPSGLVIDFDFILHDNFQYTKERCAWLEKQEFLGEIEMVYHRSHKVLQELQREFQKNPCTQNPEWLREAEAGCSSFFEHYVFCKTQLKKPIIARLNQFEPEEYVWYLIQENDMLYFLSLSDFG